MFRRLPRRPLPHVYPITGRALFLVEAVSASAILYVDRVLPDPAFGWDEAYHALYGIVIADGLRRSQWLSVGYDTFLQVYWPPLHSWYLAALFLLFGTSRVVARTGSLAALVGAAAAAYAAGCRLAAPIGSERTDATRTLGGLVASTGVLAAGGVLAVAPQAMLELLALFWLLVGCALYIRTREVRVGRATWIGLGASVLAAYLTKANYGIVLALALICAFAFDGGWLALMCRGHEAASCTNDQLAATRRGQLVALATLSVSLVFWFADPTKIAYTVRSLVNEPRGPSPTSIAGLLFYPIDLLWLAGSWPMLAYWLLVLAATVRRGPLRGDSRLRFLTILLAIQFLLAEITWTKIDRHILPMVPAFALLGAAWVGRTWYTLRSRARRIVMVAALLAILAWHIGRIAPELAAVAGDDPVRELIRQVTLAVRRSDERVLVLGGNDRLTAPAAFDWWLILDASMPVAGAGSLFQKATPVPASARRWRRDRWPGDGLRTMYAGLPLGVPPDAVLAPDTYREQVARLLTCCPVGAVVVLSEAQRAAYGELTDTFVSGVLAELGFVPKNEGSLVTAAGVLPFRRAAP